jgi:hypothetical protein
MNAGVGVLLLAASLTAQTAPPPSTNYAAELSTMLARNANGHSPTEDEILASETASGLEEPEAARAVAPLVYQALGSRDAAMRRYALAMLLGMQVLPEVATAKPSQTQTKVDTEALVAPSAAFKPKVAAQFAALLPSIAAQLLDENTDTRTLAAVVLEGFAPAPPPAIFAPLYAFLRRDDAVGPTGLGVLNDLLSYLPVTPRTAEAIAAFLGRSDQTTPSRLELIEAVASAHTQNQAANQALLAYLDADDSTLRARLILTLPRLDLASGVFEQTRSRVADLAASGQDSAEVVSAAKAITGCWTQPRSSKPCPAI